MAPFGYLAFAIWAILPTRHPERRARTFQTVHKRAFGMLHDYLRVLGLLDSDPRAVTGTLPDEPCVLVANHITYTDVTLTMASVGPCTTIVTPRIYNMRMVRPFLRASGYFPGSSGGPEELARVIHDATDRLHAGHHVLFFPEGTRAPEGAMGRFGRLAFEVAIQAGAPIVPIAIEADPVWLSKEHPISSPPDGTPNLRLHILDAIRASDQPNADFPACSRQLRTIVEDLIRARLGLDAPSSPGLSGATHHTTTRTQGAHVL